MLSPLASAAIDILARENGRDAWERSHDYDRREFSHGYDHNVLYIGSCVDAQQDNTDGREDDDDKCEPINAAHSIA